MIEVYSVYPSIESTGGIFSLKNLEISIKNKTLCDNSLSVNLFYDCYILRTNRGLRVFDTMLRPIMLSFTHRGGLGVEMPFPVLNKNDQVVRVELMDAERSRIELIEWQRLSEYKESLKLPVFDNLLYLLPWHNQFGHVVSEGLSRYWLFLNDNLDCYDNVFTGGEGRSNLISECIWSSFELLEKFKEKNIFKRIGLYGAKIKKIYIPEPAMYLGGNYHVAMKDLWQRVSRFCINNSKECFVNSCGSMIYLSRKSIDNRRCFDEDLLEHIFERLGFTVIKPELYSFQEQVSLVSNCNVLAGLSGSAMHLCQFMKDESKVLLLSPFNHIMVDLVSISRLKQLRVLYFIGGLKKNTKDKGFYFFDNECTQDILYNKAFSFIND